MGLGFIKELGSRITDVTKEDSSITFIFQALNLAVQRWNAISVMSTVPNVKKLDELFLLVDQMEERANYKLLITNH